MTKMIEILTKYAATPEGVADKAYYEDMIEVLKIGGEIILPIELKYSIAINSPVPVTVLPDEFETEIVRYDMEQVRDTYTEALHSLLDEKCITKGFNGDSQTRPFRSISNYVGYDNAFRADAELLGVWIANCFLISEAIEKDVANSSREMPSIEVFLSEMPK